MRVLIVEDEPRLAEALKQIMIGERYSAEVVHDGAAGLEFAESGLYDVVILDVMLPIMNGFDVVRQLRARKQAVPVLMLTARDDISDKVSGLDCGADDYMTKPFAPAELLARIRALSRRPGEAVFEELEFGDLVLSLSTYGLRCGTRSVHLGFKEYEVLKILMSNPRMVVSKEDMIVRVWGVDSEVEDNNVEAYISFLRKKFFYLGSKVSIGTVRKVGYRLEVEAL